ncbi:MAG: hypothetical protein V4629_09780 [Pseudomonadota bacterium]
MSDSTFVKNKTLRPLKTNSNYEMDSKTVKTPSSSLNSNNLVNEQDFLQSRSNPSSDAHIDNKTYAQEQYDFHRSNLDDQSSQLPNEDLTNQNTGSASAEPVLDLMDHIKSVWQETSAIIQGQIDLATIEAIHTAKKFFSTLLTSLVITILSTLMICTAWISLVVACAFYLMDQDFSVSASFFIVTSVHLLIFAICYGITHYKLEKATQKKMASV